MEIKFPYAIFNLNFNPARDRNELSKRKLKRDFGISKDKNKNAFYDLINIQERIIEKRARQVHVSRSLVCPSEYRHGFEYLLRKMSAGVDINTHLSKGIYKTNKNDGMLLEFGLHHFHLGDEIELDKNGNKFIKRTGPLLVAMVRPHEIYCLGVFDHDSNLWVDTNLIELIHKEWPGLLECHKMNTVYDITPLPNSSDRKKYRNVHINSPVQVSDGGYYHLIGGGANAGGGSLKASLSLADNNRILYLLEHYVPSKVVKNIIDASSCFDSGLIRLKLINFPVRHGSILLDENTGDLYIIYFYEKGSGQYYDTGCDVLYISSRFLSQHAVINEKFTLSNSAALVIASTKCYKNNTFWF